MRSLQVFDDMTIVGASGHSSGLLRAEIGVNPTSVAAVYRFYAKQIVGDQNLFVRGVGNSRTPNGTGTGNQDHALVNEPIDGIFSAVERKPFARNWPHIKYLGSGKKGRPILTRHLNALKASRHPGSGQFSKPLPSTRSSFNRSTDAIARREICLRFHAAIPAKHCRCGKAPRFDGMPVPD